MSARVAAAVSGQISAMRKSRNWNQDKLSSESGIKRSRISLLESGDYEGFTFSTLKKLASAFDVAVIVQFVSFREFLRWSESFNQAALVPESFAQSDRVVRSEDHSGILQSLFSGQQKFGQQQKDFSEEFILEYKPKPVDARLASLN
jgi:transcriptional regulator with XRE-family HTH domain